MELQRVRGEPLLPRADLPRLLRRVQDDRHGNGRPHAVRLPQEQRQPAATAAAGADDDPEAHHRH